MQTVTQQFFIFKFCVYIFDEFNAEGKSLKDNQLAMAIHCDLLWLKLIYEKIYTLN